MTKTDKSTLLTLLESKVHQHKSPGRLGASIVDGNYLLHTLSARFPATYGGVARRILTQAVTLSPKRVDIVFDDYPTPSIKDCERELRGIDDNTEYIVTGPEQVRPRNFGSALCSRSLKQQLPVFLSQEWQDQSYAQIIGSRDVYLGFRGHCSHLYVSDGQLKRDSADRMVSCNHEEADTMVCFHARSISDEGETET